MLAYSFLYVQKTFLVTAMQTPPNFYIHFNLLESFPASTIYENNKYMIYQLLSHQKIMCHSRRDRRHLRFISQELVINANVLPGKKLQPLHISCNFGEMVLHIVIKQAASHIFIAEMWRVAEFYSSPEMSALLRNRKYICISYTCKDKRTNESSRNTSLTTLQTSQSPCQTDLTSKNCPQKRFLLLSLCFIAYFPYGLLSKGGLLPRSIFVTGHKGLEKA